MSVLFGILAVLTHLYVLLLWVRFFVDLARGVARDWKPSGGLLVALGLLITVTDPPIRFFRRFVPPIRLGQIQLEFGIFLSIAVFSLLGMLFSFLQ